MVWGFWIGSGLGFLDRQWFGVSELDRSCHASNSYAVQVNCSGKL